MPAPVRRYLRVSLRTLCVLTALCAVWLAYVTNKARHQRETVARIHALGGSIEYDFQREAQPAGKGSANARPPGWLWLRRLIGDEYFQDVVCVHLHETEVTDGDLQAIGKLSKLELLSLNKTSVSDKGLEQLNGLHRLDYLGLMGTPVTSEGLVCLKNMRQLTQLILSDAQGVDDAALAHMKDLKELGFLNLDRTAVTGRGLTHLTKLENLEQLLLDRTPLDDTALQHLAKLTMLKRLSLGVTRLPEESLRELHQSLPKCTIEWGDPQSPKQLGGNEQSASGRAGGNGRRGGARRNRAPSARSERKLSLALRPTLRLPDATRRNAPLRLDVAGFVRSRFARTS
jgi:hypothetical protein